jgi:A/G-specific adenine glycosylase
MTSSTYWADDGATTPTLDIPALRSDLIRWAASRTRRFPWRDQVGVPYAILVAELLLKRTTAQSVARIYEAFLANFPSLSVLADASETELSRALEGVGLHRQRAKLTWQLAQDIAGRGGAIPSEYETLRALPGLGDYSARAILAFGFLERVGIVDSNVERLFERLRGRRVDPGEQRLLADQFVSAGDPVLINFALLDLGALVCRYDSPRCDECPLRPNCQTGSRAGIRELGQTYSANGYAALRMQRKNLGLSQRRLSELAGISKLTLIKLERGKSTPRPETVAKIQRALADSAEERRR